MLKSCLLAVAFLAGVCATASSDTFMATIIKIEDNKITIQKATYHADKAKYTFDQAMTFELAKDAIITKGHFLPADGETATGARVTGKLTPLPEGLNYKGLKNIEKNINAGKMLRPSVITIADKGDDKGKITAINLWTSASPK